MKVIYKYILTFGEPRVIDLPKDSKFVLAGFQNGNLCVWFEIETKNKSEIEQREFTIWPTGIEYPCNQQHVASLQDGSFVWHITERR